MKKRERRKRYDDGFAYPEKQRILPILSSISAYAHNPSANSGFASNQSCLFPFHNPPIVSFYEFFLHLANKHLLIHILSQKIVIEKCHFNGKTKKQGSRKGFPVFRFYFIFFAFKGQNVLYFQPILLTVCEVLRSLYCTPKEFH